MYCGSLEVHCIEKREKKKRRDITCKIMETLCHTQQHLMWYCKQIINEQKCTEADGQVSEYHGTEQL